MCPRLPDCRKRLFAAHPARAGANLARLIWLVSMLTLAACAGVPDKLDHEGVVEVTPTQARSGDATGSRVRWGGEIITTRAGDEETCLEILRRPLDRRGRPETGDTQLGRFIACTSEFLDPFVHKTGREITVVGQVTDPVEGRIDEHHYRYPALKIEALHLWAPQQQPDPRYRDPYWDPFWDPFWHPRWDPWGPYGYSHPRYRR